ncbi:MAG: DUF503 domain-containing protein [Oscillochloris sp.]|nr:DUF503 domain-containing protein [Oscillochloris sp.]
MIIGTCTIELSIPIAHSLKEKRRVVKSLLARVRNDFNVSIAEVDDQDRWQSAVFGVACVSTSQQYAHGQLEAVVRFIEDARPDCPLVGYAIEML